MKVLDLNKKIKVGYQFHEFTTTHAHSFWEFCIVNKGPIIHKTNKIIAIIIAIDFFNNVIKFYGKVVL